MAKKKNKNNDELNSKSINLLNERAKLQLEASKSLEADIYTLEKEDTVIEVYTP